MIRSDKPLAKAIKEKKTQITNVRDKKGPIDVTDVKRFIR